MIDEIEFVPEIVSDCASDEIKYRTMDFLFNYEDELIDLEQLKDCEHRFVALELYNLAEACKRAHDACKIVFK